MKITLIPTSASWTTPAPERLGCSSISTPQGSGLSYADAPATGAPVMGAPVMDAISHLAAFGGVRNDAPGVPPRSRPV